VVRNILLCISSVCALLLIPFLIQVRDAAGELAVVDKYSELLNSSAITENPTLVAKITGKAIDRMAVPQFLWGSRDSTDIAVLAMLVPILISLGISLAGVAADIRSRANRTAKIE
jgi:hypothetical protein